jgi:hypothetical protein
MAFWIYGIISFLGLLWVHRSLPETKGKSLEEIGMLFRGRSSSVDGTRHTRLRSNSSDDDDFVEDGTNFGYDRSDEEDGTKHLVPSDELTM